MSGREGALVTVTERLLVRVPPERLWDYSQDYARRAEWDASIRTAEVLEGPPLPRVRVLAQGGLRAVFRYKHFERPLRTSLVMEEVESRWIEGGGGSWSYERHAEGTLWTQTNALRLRPGWARTLLAPLVRAGLRSSTRRAMRAARSAVERGA